MTDIEVLSNQSQFELHDFHYSTFSHRIVPCISCSSECICDRSLMQAHLFFMPHSRGATGTTSVD